MNSVLEYKGADRSSRKAPHLPRETPAALLVQRGVRVGSQDREVFLQRVNGVIYPFNIEMSLPLWKRKGQEHSMQWLCVCECVGVCVCV